MSLNTLTDRTMHKRDQEAAGGAPPAATKHSKRMALLRRMGLFGSDTKGAVIRRAVTIRELEAAYRLVHDAFVEREYIRPTSSGLRVRPFEALPETATFIATVGDEVVGVQSIAVNNPEMGLPSDGVFRDEIDVLRIGESAIASGSGHLVCEATNQAIAPAYRKSAVATELMRCMFAHALAVGCDELITTVSPGHARFYELLGFEQVSPVRSYSATVDDPVVVMRVNVAELIGRAAAANDDSEEATIFIKCRCLASNPYREKVRQWEAEAAEVFEDAEALRTLFVEKSGLLLECSDEEREAIRRCWGDALFGAVCPNQVAELCHV